MKTTHADDQSIQQCIFDLDTCDNDIIAHINSCNVCQQVANSYKVLITDLKEQEYPILDFNLEDRILEQLPNQIEQEQPYKAYSLTGPLIVISIGIIALLTNSFIGDLKHLIGANKLSTYFIICIGLFITTLLSMDLVKLYKSKMNKINFS